VCSSDLAYHQGTVWPWLVGAYVEATLAAFGRSRGVVRRLRALLDGFAPATEAYGLGHVAEVFDGDPPHRPGGTFAQAWSDAELLRAYALLDGPGSRGSP
jgi:glycogen debranching enzyme